MLDKGRVSAQGTHDQLMGNSSIYQKLWSMSSKAVNWNIDVKGDDLNV
ncbi:MAG: hypothetical protein ACI4SF_10730 [Oscillospiraceae bacterium]